MKRFYKTSSTKKGLPPGSLIHIGKDIDKKTSIEAIAYDNDNLKKITVNSFQELRNYENTALKIWVNVTGYSNIELIEEFGRTFNIHSLVLEDILNTHQRVKLDDYENYLFLVLKQFSVKNDEINYDQLSIILFKNFIFTFTSNSDSLIDFLTKRLEKDNTKIRKGKADYLLYVIIDIIIDQYFTLIDIFNDRTEEVDEKLLLNPVPEEILSKIHNIRAEIIKARRSVSPVRDVLMFLMRNDIGQIKPSVRVYYRDVYDHTIRIIESLDSYREIAAVQLEIYLSSISNKMNSIMKVLTIFASIFIPLTFIAGVYGMNFKYMPELKWKYSYPALWCVFILIGFCLIIFFKKKKWL